MATKPTAYTDDQLIEQYFNLKDQLSHQKAIFEEKAKKLKDSMELIATVMLARMNEAGQESTKTSAGTASVAVDEFFNFSDTDEFYSFVHENKAFDLLVKRLNSTNMKAFQKEHGELPPGVGITTKRKVSFKPPRKS